MKPNALYAFRYYQDRHNLAPHQAAGLVGTFIQESGANLNTGARNKGDGRDGSDSIGIAQWNSGRARGLKSFASERGTDWTDLDTQLDYAIHEMRNGGERRAGKRPFAATTVEEAAEAAIDFERPYGWKVGNSRGGHGWGNRYANAQSLLGASPEAIAAARASSAPMPAQSGAGAAPAAPGGMLAFSQSEPARQNPAVAAIEQAVLESAFAPAMQNQRQPSPAAPVQLASADDSWWDEVDVGGPQVPAASQAPVASAQADWWDEVDVGPAAPAPAAVAPQAPQAQAIMANPAASFRDAQRQSATQDRGALAASTVGGSQGLTFGFGDEIMAGAFTPIEMAIGAWSGEDAGKGFGDRVGDAYNRGLDLQRAQLQSAQTNHPVATTVGDVAGGATIMMPSMAAMVPASKAGRLAVGVAEGAGYGALSGFGSGEGGFANRAENAAGGAAMGAGAGLVAPFAAAGGRAIYDRAFRRTGAARDDAFNMMRAGLGDDGLSIQDAARMADEIGPHAMLADVSPAIRYRTEQIANSDTMGRAPVAANLRARQEGSKDRVVTAFDSALGPTPNVEQTLAAMSQRAKDNASGLYGQARQENVPVNVRPTIEVIDGLMLSPAERIAGPSSLPDDEVDKALRWVRSQLTDGDNVRTGIDRLDKLERRIRAKTKAAFSSGQSDVGTALSDVGRSLRAQMIDSSPVYAQARATYSDDLSVKDAFESGRAVFSAKTHPDFLAREIADMSQAELEALRLGTRAAVDQVMGQVRNGSLRGRQLLDADFNERKVRLVLGDADADVLIRALNGEQTVADTSAQVLGGSQTARRMDNPFTRQNDSVASNAINIARAAAGDPLGAAASVVDVARSGRVSSRANRQAGAFGNMATATGAERQRVIDEFIARIERNRFAGQSGDWERLMNSLLKGGVIASSNAQWR